jgi:hypothetical protein
MFRKAVALAAVCLFTFVACGGDDGTDGTTEPADQPAENRVEIGMTEFAFSVPTDITGGNVTLEFENKGELVHEAAFGASMTSTT